jgi:hypothetical protein
MTKEPINLSAFKDGVADGLLEGNRSDYHPDMYSYKQGYDLIEMNLNNLDTCVLVGIFILYDKGVSDANNCKNRIK